MSTARKGFGYADCSAGVFFSFRSSRLAFHSLKNGKKVAVSFDTDTFIQYINTYHLVDNNEKAYLVDKERQTIPDTCDATLFFWSVFLRTPFGVRSFYFILTAFGI